MNVEKSVTLNLKNDLIVTTLENEGLIVDIKTRRTYWVNETASYFLDLLKGNTDGFPLRLIKSLVLAKYKNALIENVSEDIDDFTNNLKMLGLISIGQRDNGKKITTKKVIKNKFYMKPIIENDDNSINNNIAAKGGSSSYAPGARAGRVSSAVRSAQRSGNRAF